MKHGKIGRNSTRRNSRHSFSNIPRAEIQRSSFDRSHGVKTAFSAGKLIPIFCDEALPGDTFNIKLHQFARLGTPLHPIMDNLYLETHFFSVPCRLLYSDWQKMNGEQTDPADSTDFSCPTVSVTGGTSTPGTISDYLGIPPQATNKLVCAFWHRAYNLIWNEWFRDENLQDSVTVNMDAGPDNINDYTILNRGKRKDYFTSCLPWPTKGAGGPLLLGGKLPVTPAAAATPPTWQKFEDAGAVNANLTFTNSSSDTGWDYTVTATGDAVWDEPNLEVDLNAATNNTINQLREAFAIQKLYEKDARGGTRYTEMIKVHFNVSTPDQRLQRPEYIGGGSQPINVTPVPGTNQGPSPSTVGQLGAYGTTSGTVRAMTHSFTEHCVVLGLVSVRADLNYQAGINKMFLRESRFDFYLPSLAHLGEQAVLNEEIFALGDTAPGPTDDKLVFGYQERWAEYRYKQSMITGIMRSNTPAPLDPWHLAQDLDPLPTLGTTFIKENPPMARVLAVASPTEPEIIYDGHFEFTAARPMPTYSVPGMIDRF